MATFKIDSKSAIEEITQGLSLSEIAADVSFSTLGATASKNIADSLEANKNTSQYLTNLDLQAVQFKTAQANGTDGPRHISNQLLIEPLKALSPDSVINNTIAGSSTMAKGFVTKATETLEKTAELSQTPDQVNNQELKDGLKAAGTKCATIAEQEANQAELAHGNSLTASYASQTIAANGLRFHSDTTIAARSPHFGLNTQDYHVQANNSAIVVADIHLNQSRQSVTLTDGAHITQAKTGLQISSEAHDTISRNLRNAGVEQYTSMGKTNSAIADETLIGVSGGNIQQTAYESISHRAAGSVSIVAAPGPKPEATIQASGESGESGESEGSGESAEAAAELINEIHIIANDASSNLSAMSLSRIGALTASSSNAMIAAAETAVVSGTAGTATISQDYNYIGTPDAGMIVSGGRVFVNTIPSVFAPAQIPEITQLPSLPALPQLPTQDLSNCLPQELGGKDASETKSAGNKGQILRIKPEKGSGDSTTPSPLDEEAPIELIPEGGSTSNPRQIPRALGGEVTSSVPGMSPSKLPGVAATDSADKAQSESLATASGSAALDTGALSGAAVNIYLEKQNETPGLNLSRAANSLPSNLKELMQNQEAVETAISAATRAASISPTLLESALSGIIPIQALKEFNDPNLFRALSLVKDKLETGLTLADFPEGVSSEVAEKAVKLLNAYPDAAAPILSILDQVTALPAIGFLDALTSVLGNLNLPGLDQLSGVLSLPNLVSAGNVGGIVNLVSQYADLGPIGNILSSSSIQSLSQALFSGDLSQVQSAFGDLVLSQVSQHLPSEVSGAAGAIQSILMGIKSGESVDSNALIGQIAGALGQITGSEEISRATQIYGSLQGLIGSIQSGDITSALTGGNMQSLLSTVLGARNAGVVGQVFSLIQNAMGTASAFAAVPQLMQMMGEHKIPMISQLASALSCLDLFNKVRNLLSQAQALADEFGDEDDNESDEDSSSNPASTKKGNRNAAKLIEFAPRMMQIINSTKLIPPVFLERSELNALATLEIPYTLDPCYRIPRLTIAESMVQVLEVKNNQVTFTLPNLDLLTREIRFYPKLGDMIQLYISGFQDGGEFLIPYQTNFQYTPSIYNFVITEFDLEQNRGIAISANTTTSIILEDSSGILMEYSPQSIGVQLIPTILDAYLLA